MSSPSPVVSFSDWRADMAGLVKQIAEHSKVPPRILAIQGDLRLQLQIEGGVTKVGEALDSLVREFFKWPIAGMEMRAALVFLLSADALQTGVSICVFTALHAFLQQQNNEGQRQIKFFVAEAFTDQKAELQTLRSGSEPSLAVLLKIQLMFRVPVAEVAYNEHKAIKGAKAREIRENERSKFKSSEEQTRLIIGDIIEYLKTTEFAEVELMADTQRDLRPMAPFPAELKKLLFAELFVPTVVKMPKLAKLVIDEDHEDLTIDDLPDSFFHELKQHYTQNKFLDAQIKPIFVDFFDGSYDLLTEADQQMKINLPPDNWSSFNWSNRPKLARALGQMLETYPALYEFAARAVTIMSVDQWDEPEFKKYKKMPMPLITEDFKRFEAQLPLVFAIAVSSDCRPKMQIFTQKPDPDDEMALGFTPGWRTGEQPTILFNYELLVLARKHPQHQMLMAATFRAVASHESAHHYGRFAKWSRLSDEQVQAAAGQRPTPKKDIVSMMGEAGYTMEHMVHGGDLKLWNGTLEGKPILRVSFKALDGRSYFPSIHWIVEFNKGRKFPGFPSMFSPGFDEQVLIVKEADRSARACVFKQPPIRHVSKELRFAMPKYLC